MNYGISVVKINLNSTEREFDNLACYFVNWYQCTVHGMTPSIHVIFNAVVVAKLTYAASSWCGLTTADDRQRLEAVIRRGIRSRLCAPDYMSLEDLVTDADD